jgi:ribonuclease D
MIHIIEDNEALHHICEELRSSDVLFVDTEFVRERSYYPQLCLIQIAGLHGEVYLIDVLAKGLDIAPLLELIYQPHVLKVMHAARQDVEILYHLKKDVPTPLYDTQIAAMFLGLGEQVGYANLVQHFLQIKPCKAQQYTNWAVRPLSDEQVAYAADDVRHLRECYPLLCAAITKRGRDAWVAEEMEALQHDAWVVAEEESLWRRIKRRSDNPHYLARLRALCIWREQEAKRRDVPRGKIFHDDTLQEIAFSNPVTLEKLATIRGLPSQYQRSGALFSLLEKASELPLADCPEIGRAVRLSEPQELLRDALKIVLKVTARQHSISSGVLCDGDSLQLLSMGAAVDEVLRGWRYALFGHAAESLLAGRCSITVQQGEVSIGKFI